MKANGALLTVSHAALEISQRRRDYHISTAPTTVRFAFQTELKEEELVCRGKVEIQKQDSHFPTAPMACGARKEHNSYEVGTLVP
jgi:hypothetical protein